ncbi:putative 2-aminoethylphosphonate ABC transporter substrate-binding protein [Brucella gallinifaecis]|uniref:Putative 2-aminoethylphosphonate ABC transporter substrate-binding protein n=1 Tax=Brucella gallinifaecis TaxID=215590 RepID=A0A502BLM9_9HYPH|nr:putative 2-aminoethylphosphonate ABC transporter substrate-binding protein [Brucella gallinifaecis]TPF74737.1 putative 2-aminoethylphosphonate ABC transporter substrate-binding protein [Brucella gallinifaecis]
MALLKAPYALIASLGLFYAGGAYAQKAELVVYTTLEKEQLAPYAAAFTKDNPDISITWLRESPGILVARVLAEKQNLQADVFWGIPLTNLLSFEKDDLLMSYRPAGAEELKPRFQDTRENPTWAGMDTWLSMICYNSVEGEKRGIPAPKTWQDLANPVYKGQIVMPNAVSSHSGYMNVNDWLQKLGNDKGWEFMDALNQNIASYTHSGTKPCKMAAAGEYVVGISNDIVAPSLKSKGAPIDIIVPSDKVSWEIEASAIAKTTKNPEAAKRLMDWTVSKQANEEYNKFMAIVARPDVTGKPKNYPENAESLLSENDYAVSLANRDAVLVEWSKRYDAKSEPKQ